MKNLLRILSLTLILAMLLIPTTMAEGVTITVYNWQDYIDKEVISLFEAETGIKVQYVNFSTNEDMYVKLRSGGTSYDVAFPSDYMIERLIKEDRVEKLDLANIPNYANLMENLKINAYDPTSEYSVPYMWGTVGILYNTEMTGGPIDSWEAMWDDKYVGSVLMLDSFRDTLGITLKMLGYSMNTRNEDELNQAKDRLIDQKVRGIVKAYQVDETKDKMIAGEAALGLVWSGDAAYAMSENDKLAYVVPKEGSNIWVDGMVIPKGAAHKAEAEAFINFLCRTDIGRMNIDEIGYYTPLQTVVDEMTPEELADNTFVPEEGVVERCEFFNDVTDFIDVYDDIWLEIKSAR